MPRVDDVVKYKTCNHPDRQFAYYPPCVTLNGIFYDAENKSEQCENAI